MGSSTSSTQGASGPTLGSLLSRILVAALAFTMLRSLGSGEPGPEFWLALGLAFPALMVRDLFDGLMGVGCPHCGQRAMGQISARPFRARYYLCSLCGARRKRSLAGPWTEASGPDDEPVYARQREAGRWIPGPDLEFGPDPRAGVHGRLLLSKLSRRYDGTTRPEDRARPNGHRDTSS